MKIEIGKRYVTRDGRVTGKVQTNLEAGWALYPYYFTVKQNGRYVRFTCDENGRYVGADTESSRDLVKEYLPVPPLKRWIQLAVAILALMVIGAVINSFVYRVARKQWKNTETEKLVEEWNKVIAAHGQLDSLEREMQVIIREYREKEAKP